MDFQVQNIRYPSREEWEEGLDDGRGITIYTDGSKMEKGTGAGLHSTNLQLNQSFRLPDDCSVFQAEVYAIDRAAKLLKDSTVSDTNITIFVDSHAALKALESNLIKSDIVRRCRASLASIRHLNVSLCWVPGHSGIEGNEVADEMARKGSDLDISEADNSVRPPLGHLLGKIVEYENRATDSLWTNRADCEVSRSLWPCLDRKDTSFLLRLNKSAVRVLTGVITGHCAIAPMLRRWRVPTSSLCRSCQDEEEEESIYHFLCRCPGLQRRRLRFLGARFIDSLAEVGKMDVSLLLGFIRESKWFVEDH